MEILFIYGTLQDPEVQQRIFGRITAGTPDQLDGFRKDSWEGYPMAVPDENSSIDGRVLEVTMAEIKQMDIYEGSAYLRDRVVLRSGIETWIYRNLT